MNLKDKVAKSLPFGAISQSQTALTTPSRKAARKGEEAPVPPVVVVSAVKPVSTHYGALMPGPEFDRYLALEKRHDAALAFRKALSVENKAGKLALCDAFLQALDPADRGTLGDIVQDLRKFTEAEDDVHFGMRMGGLKAAIDVLQYAMGCVALTVPKSADRDTVQPVAGQRYGLGASLRSN